MPATLLYGLVLLFLLRTRAGLNLHRCDAAATTDQRQSLFKTPAEAAVADIYPLVQAFRASREIPSRVASVTAAVALDQQCRRWDECHLRYGQCRHNPG